MEQEIQRMIGTFTLICVVSVIALIIGMVGLIKTNYPEENKYEKRSILWTMLAIFGLFIGSGLFAGAIALSGKSAWLVSLALIPGAIVFGVILFDILRRQKNLYHKVNNVDQFKYVQKVFYNTPEYRFMLMIFIFYSIMLILSTAYIPSFRKSSAILFLWILLGVLAYLIYSHIVGMLWRRAADDGIIKDEDIHWRYMSFAQKMTNFGTIPKDLKEDFTFNRE